MGEYEFLGRLVTLKHQISRDRFSTLQDSYESTMRRDSTIE